MTYLIEKGGVAIDADSGLFSVNFDKMAQAVADLTHDIMVLQGDGDKKAVDAFIEKYSALDAATKQALERIENAGKLLKGFWIKQKKTADSPHFRHSRRHSTYLSDCFPIKSRFFLYPLFLPLFYFFKTNT